VAIKLHSATIEPLDDNDVLRNAFALITQKKTSYIFWSLTPKEKSDWIKNLQQLIEMLDKNLSTLSREEETIADLQLPPNIMSPSEINRQSMQLQQTPTQQQRLSTQITNAPQQQNYNLVTKSLQSGSNQQISPVPPNRMSVQVLNQQQGNRNVGQYLGGSDGVTAIAPVTPQPKAKIRQALGVYEDVFRLEMEIFQLPIDLSTLFPGYFQRLPINYQQILWGRIQLLKEKVMKMTSLHDDVLSVIKSENLALKLEKTILEGKGPVGSLQAWVKENFPASNPNSQQPRNLIIQIMKWLNSLLKLWEQILDEECD